MRCSAAADDEAASTGVVLAPRPVCAFIVRPSPLRLKFGRAGAIARDEEAETDTDTEGKRGERRPLFSSYNESTLKLSCPFIH